MSIEEDSIDNLKDLQISTVEDDDEEQEEQDFAEEPDTDDDDDEEEPVTLGFLEKPKNRWSLLRQLFPSKAGGIPSWLDPVNLPSGTSCVCDICGNPLQFLVQVYAPIDEQESAFHRTLYVFMCLSMSCLLRDQNEQCKSGDGTLLRSVKVFRCQLPRANPFYSSKPPRQDGTDKPLGNGVALCSWCGTWKGDKVCSLCRKERYCSKKHQAMHWRSGHKVDCLQMTSSSQSSPSNGIAALQKVVSKTLWPEHEIINEDECEFDTEIPGRDEVASMMLPENQIVEKVKSVMNNCEANDDLKSWASFQQRIAKAPEQVVRYCRSATSKPLWPMPSGRLSIDHIPKCMYCGGPRSFEFQILPQLLYYFDVKNDVDSLDWATIVVYTCATSCEESAVAYKEEFAWVQLSSQSRTLPL